MIFNNGGVGKRIKGTGSGSLGGGQKGQNKSRAELDQISLNVLTPKKIINFGELPKKEAKRQERQLGSNFFSGKEVCQSSTFCGTTTTTST